MLHIWPIKVTVGRIDLYKYLLLQIINREFSNLADSLLVKALIVRLHTSFSFVHKIDSFGTFV